MKIGVSPPILKDSDPEFDRHWRSFEATIQSQTFNGRKVKPMDFLTIYRKCLPQGSIRARVYDTNLERAKKQGRIPDDAEAVTEKIALSSAGQCKDTKLRVHERLEREFSELKMTGSHSEFRSRWEQKLYELEDADMIMANANDDLRRKYLAKLPDELRSVTMQRQWALDGGDSVRKSSTWEDVAKAVEIELSTRVDIKAPSDSTLVCREFPDTVNALEGTMISKICKQTEHHKEMSPPKAAQTR